MVNLSITAATLSMIVPVAGAFPVVTTDPGVVVSEPEDDHFSGAVVKSIDWENKSFKIAIGEKGDELHTIMWNDATRFWLDDKESTSKVVLIESGKIDVTVNENGYASSVLRLTK